jgi:hypothetical protein
VDVLSTKQEIYEQVFGYNLIEIKKEITSEDLDTRLNGIADLLLQLNGVQKHVE